MSSTPKPPSPFQNMMVDGKAVRTPAQSTQPPNNPSSVRKSSPKFWVSTPRPSGGWRETEEFPLTGQELRSASTWIKSSALFIRRP